MFSDFMFSKSGRLLKSFYFISKGFLFLLFFSLSWTKKNIQNSAEAFFFWQL